MTDRDSALLAVRPAVRADPDAAATEAEAFLHRTLRPVLKLQNATLLALVRADVPSASPASTACPTPTAAPGWRPRSAPTPGSSASCSAQSWAC